MYNEFLEICSEQELFIYIYYLGGWLWQVEHDLADERYPSSPETEQWIVETRDLIERGVDATTRFGNYALARTNNGATEPHWDWYYKMKEWFDTLSEEDVLEWYERMPWNA